MSEKSKPITHVRLRITHSTLRYPRIKRSKAYKRIKKRQSRLVKSTSEDEVIAIGMMVMLVGLIFEDQL